MWLWEIPQSSNNSWVFPLFGIRFTAKENTLMSVSLNADATASIYICKLNHEWVQINYRKLLLKGNDPRPLRRGFYFVWRFR